MLRSGYFALAACALSAALSACGGGSGKDDAPLASNITLSVTEDTPVKISIAEEGVTATLVAAPTRGDVTFSTSGPLTFTYTPHLNDSGIDGFTYQLSDGKKTSNVGTVAIGINAVNDLPAIQPTLTTDEDVPVTAVLITDVEGDPFTSAVVTPAGHGTLNVDPANPGKWTYAPAPDFNGTDTFELSATYTYPDTTTATVKGTVTVTVRPVDDPPSGVGQSVHTVQGQAVRIDAQAVTITAAPSVGTATVNADGSIQYTPTESFVGTTSLEYEVRDAQGRTSRATTSIDVGLTSGIVYLSRPDASQPNELYFSDGARSFKVNGTLPAGESIDSVKAATAAPVVFYRTQSGGLYRVDLRKPGVANSVAQGVGEFAIDAAGSKVGYAEGGTFKLADFSAATTVVRDLSTDEYYALGLANSRAPKLLSVNPDTQLLKRFGATATMGPRADDGSFAVVVAAGDLHVLNLRDTSQVLDITHSATVGTPTLVPNF